MRIRLEAITADPRIFDVLIDFSEYDKNKYYPRNVFGRRNVEVTNDVLDGLLATVKLRRIKWWMPGPWHRKSHTINTYRTTVISDRNFPNDTRTVS